MDRLAKSQVGIVRLSDGSPQPVHLENRQDVIVIHTGRRHQVQDERPEAYPPESQGSKDAPIETVSLPVSHDPQRRTVKFLGFIRDIVQIFLHGNRTLKVPEYRPLGLRKMFFKFVDRVHPFPFDIAARF